MSRTSKSFYNFSKENSRTPRGKNLGNGRYQNGYGVEYSIHDKKKFELIDKKTKSINNLMDNIHGILEENGFRSYYDYTNYIEYGQLNKIRSQKGFEETLNAINKELKNISTRGTGSQIAFKKNYLAFLKNNFEGSEDRDKAIRYVNSLSPMELDMLRSVREDFSLRFHYDTNVGGNIKEIIRELEKYQGISYNKNGRAVKSKSSPQSKVINAIAKHNSHFNRIGKTKKRR